VEGGVRTLRLFATALLLTAGALLVPAVRPPPAAAQEPQAFVSITLTSIEPALPAPGSTVTLKGTVTNTSPIVLSNLQAIFWRAPDVPLLTPDALNRSLTWPANEPLGQRLSDNYQNIPSETNRILKPGKSTAFTVQATMDELNFSLQNGVYLVGVHVRGRTEVNGADVTLGRARVFLPVQTAKPANSIQTTSVVILNSRPSQVGKSQFSDDHLAREVAANGRLDGLIKAADADDVSFAIDPALIDELRAMKAGYTVIGSDASTDDGQSAAARWLEKFNSLKSNRDGFRLLYGSPDIAALVHSNQTKLLADGQLAALTVEGVSTLPVLVFPAGGTADAETLAAAENLEPTAILLSDISTGEQRPLLTGPGKAPIISFTASSFGGGPGPDPRNTPVHVQQRTLAETWIEANSAPAGSTLGRIHVVRSAAQAGASSAKSASAPWITRGTLSELLRSEPVIWDQQLNYPKALRAAELNANQLRLVRRLATSYGTYTDLLAEPDNAKVTAASSLARSTSSSWRRAQHAMRKFVRPQQDELDTILTDKIEIRTSRKVTTVARKGVGFPITVRNTLPAQEDPASLTDAVRVRLLFESQVEQRLRVEPLDIGLVRAGGNVSGTASVDAEANGTVPVTAQLTTMSGTPVGRPITIQVTATQAGTTGWIIVLISGPVLIGGVALRIRQVARERSEASAAPPPTDALSSKPPSDQLHQTLDA
jgi:hypothetical protein